MATIQLKTAQTRVAFLPDDAEQKYVTRAVQYSTIKSEDLIRYASENSGLSKALMAAAFYALQQQVEQFVCNGHAIELGELGTFYISVNAKATDSADEAGSAAVYRLTVKFRQSKKLRELLNSEVTLISPTTATTSTSTDDSGTGDSGTGDEEEVNPFG